MDLGVDDQHGGSSLFVSGVMLSMLSDIAVGFDGLDNNPRWRRPMPASSEPVEIVTVASCSNLRDEHRGHVAVSGSYGGKYNAYNAAKWPVRAVIMNDAGIGKDDAGIVGLTFLEQIGMAAATADAWTCHIGDGAHILAHGVISHVNKTAAALGCKAGQSVRDCAELMRAAVPPSEMPPAISDGARYILRDGQPGLVCADSIGMIVPEDAGKIVVTASHGALSGGRPDNAVAPDVYACFFSDGGVGMDGAGIARLAPLDQRNIPAGAVSADSAPIGNARALYHDGVLSHVNHAAVRAGARPGMRLSEFIEILTAAAKRP
jgi:hypothetical protein